MHSDMYALDGAACHQRQLRREANCSTRRQSQCPAYVAAERLNSFEVNEDPYSLMRNQNRIDAQFELAAASLSYLIAARRDCLIF
jgi:hypothetical protein